MSALAVALPVLLAAWFAVPVVLRRRQVARLARACAARRAIVLSYDDGPGEAVTPALLDLLARRGVRASFFVIGREAGARPGHVARLLSEGHEVGNHTQDHRNAWKSPPWVPVPDIRAGRRSLDRLGVPPGPFRPPFGKMTPATWIETWRTGQSVAFWTVDSRDSWEIPLAVPAVLGLLEARRGGVVLMHDRDSPPRARPEHDHCRHVLALTEAIIDFADHNGFVILRLCDLDKT